MKNKISLRLKLSDFISTEMEESVMEKISKTHNDSRVAVLLYLWYDTDEIDNDDLKNFLMRWEDILSFRTIIKHGSKLRPSNFIWFDIVPTGVSTSEVSGRFQYHYINPEKLVDGIKKFKEIVYKKMIVEKSLGDGKKTPSFNEKKNINVVRKSVVAKSFIKIGEKFTNKNLTFKRPGTGLSPMIINKIIGKKAKKFFHKDEIIKI